jgi:hypothetical protein
MPLYASQMQSPWLYVEGGDELFDTRERAGRRGRRHPAPTKVQTPPPPGTKSIEDQEMFLGFPPDIWADQYDVMNIW